MRFLIGERFTAVPEGEYEVVLKDIKDHKTYKRPSLMFVFEIVKGEHAGTKANAFLNINYKTFSPFTKLYKWHTTVLGHELGPDEEINTDVFLNKVLRVKVEAKIAKKTKNTFSNVTDILGVIRDLE